jgi:hypothetical protein
MHPSVLELFLKMNIVYVPIQRARNLGKRQIVGAGHSDRTAIQECMKHTLSTDAPII